MRIESSPLRPFAFCLVALFSLALGACSSGGRVAKIKTGSVSIATVGLMQRLDMPRAAPIMIRVFKEEATLEVWKQERNGSYGLLRTYPICRFSGKLGPKIGTASV